MTLTLPWESFLSQEEQEDMDERSACGAEPGQAEVTPGQGSSPAPSVAATAPANSAAGWPRPELGQTRLASAGKMHICLIDIPNCTSESCMCLLLMRRNTNYFLKELHYTKRKCRKLKSKLQVSWSRKLLLFRRSESPGRFQM